MHWLLILAFALIAPAASAQQYFPPPDAQGGWRQLRDAAEIKKITGIHKPALDQAFAYIRNTSRNGGLLVVKNGWLVYEEYFGKGHRDGAPNLASCGKSVTSVALGILLGERRDLFPHGLDQKIFGPKYLPADAFPVSDPRKAEIRLGHLLAMTAGIRGNTPGMVKGRRVAIDPPGPDGWQANVDAVALGNTNDLLNTAKLWCKPGEGWSYATSSVHLASMILRRATGMELEEFVGRRLAKPMGWGNFGYGYRRPELTHTPGGGGIAVRATDMLRFGYLLLRNGRWNASQLVPSEYVRQCGRRSKYNPHSAYSLQFHVNADGHAAGVPRDAFWKPGSGGHCLYVIPSLDLVIWKLGGRDGQYDDTPVPPVTGHRPAKFGTVSIDADVAVVETMRQVVGAIKSR